MLGLTAGQVFGEDFQIIRPLGEGGMGSVYLALQRSTGRKRALKILQPHLVADPRIRERFSLEARAASNLQTDHVVEVAAAGIDAHSGMPWLAMEYLEGETLRARVKNFGRLPPREVGAILRQLGHGLATAHQAGLVHRDLKPANVFIADPRREGIPFTVKLLDFGIVQLGAGAQAPYSGPLHPGQSAPIGSPGWMAPEQFQAHSASPTCDIWAFGLLAYYCLVGQSFWVSTDVQALIDEVVHAAHPRASERAWQLGVTLPRGFDEWFARCIARDPGQRFASVQQAVQAVLPLLAAGDAVHAGTPPVPSGAAYVTLTANSGPGAAYSPTANQSTLAAPAPQQAPPSALGPTAPDRGIPTAAPSYVTLPATDSPNTFSPLANPPGNTLPPKPEKSGSSWLLVAGLGAGALLLLGALGVGGLWVWAPWEEPEAASSASTASAEPKPTDVEPTAAPSESSVVIPTSTSRAALPKSDKPAATPTSSSSAEPAPTASEPAGAPTPTAAAGFRALMASCWRNNEGENAPQAVNVSALIRINDMGTVQNVIMSGADAYPNLKRCVVRNGTSYRGFKPPTFSEATISTTLPAAKPAAPAPSASSG
ncbi:MAG: protein kinase [Polyangiaceae bacterium]